MAEDEKEKKQDAPAPLTGGGETRPAWLSQVVEVQFEGGVRPDVLTAEGAAAEFVGDAQVQPLEVLNSILREGGCSKVERAFDMLPAGPAAEAAAAGAPDLSGFYLLHFPEETDGRAVAEKLRAVPGVKYAAAVPKIKPASAVGVTLPDDELLAKQWYIKRCAVEHAWALGLTGKGIVIADIDFGFRIDHPDLKPRINPKRTFNATDNGPDVSVGPHLRHGTAVLGLAGAAADHSGMVGIAHGAELWAVQASVLQPSLEPGAWCKAILWVVARAVEDQKKVVLIVEGQSEDNGNVTQIGFVRKAIQYAIAVGVVVCVPAGNGNKPVNLADDGRTFEPVGVIVGATDIKDQPWAHNKREGSNFGADVVVAAPGDPDNDLTCSDDLKVLYSETFGATSGATPKVAGAIALMLEANPRLRHDDVVEILRNTGTPVVGKPLGNLLDCKAAVCAANNFRIGDS